MELKATDDSIQGINDFAGLYQRYITNNPEIVQHLRTSTSEAYMSYPITMRLSDNDWNFSYEPTNINNRYTTREIFESLPQLSREYNLRDIDPTLYYDPLGSMPLPYCTNTIIDDPVSRQETSKVIKEEPKEIEIINDNRLLIDKLQELLCFIYDNKNLTIKETIDKINSMINEL